MLHPKAWVMSSPADRRRAARGSKRAARAAIAEMMNRLGPRERGSTVTIGEAAASVVADLEKFIPDEGE